MIDLSQDILTYGVEWCILSIFIKRTMRCPLRCPVSESGLRIILPMPGSLLFDSYLYLGISGSFFHVTFLPFDVAFCSDNNSIHARCGFYANDSLNCPTLRLCWNSPTKISWFGWETLIVYPLNLVKYSLGDSECPYRTLNKLVVDTFLCFLAEKCCTIFLVKSW